MGWYDRAELYDAWFDWDPAAERDFVLGASERWGRAAPGRVLEPFCGPGRLLRAMPGYAVGFDLNRRMLAHAARGCRVFRADAARFAVAPASFDLAYCLIDSFRHLLSEDAAAGHLRCVARALASGAVYVLGLDVSGDLPCPDVSSDAWAGGGVQGAVRSLGDADPTTRLETMHVRLEAGPEVVEDFYPMRVYTRRQLEDLIDDEGSFEIAAVFARDYDLARPVELAEIEGSAVLVLRKD